MKKKILSLLLAIWASMGIISAENGQCGDMLYWNLSNGVLTITGYQGMVFGDGKIWDAMDATKYGTTYAAPWYSYRSSIYSIIISEGVTYIGNCAFLGCSNAQTINIPNSVNSIGHSAFKGCSSLTSITIPDGVTTIRYGTFAGCSNLSSIAVPNSILSIENGIVTGKVVTNAGAFSECSSLTSIIIPTSITSIGEGAFYKCTNLSSITIPNSVTHLGDYIFYGCSNLSSVTIGNGVSSIGIHAFTSSGITSIAIPNSITTISDHAFELCKNLSSISLGRNVTSIGNESFTGCSSLVSLAIPTSVTTIGENAFNSCTNLESVHFSEGLKLIKSGGFMNCSSLRSVILPNSLDSIGWQCFNLCSPMDTILIGENLKGKNPSFPSAKVVIWNAKNADIEGIPCRHLTIGEKVETLPRSVYNNMIPDTIICYPTYPPAIYPTENAGTTNAKANTILHLTATTYISIPCGTLNNYLATTGWEDYIENMHERTESGCEPTAHTSFTVTFQDWDGTVLKSEQVDKGKSATAPTNPTREGYTFTGWDKTFSNVQSDLMITAQYKKNNPSSPFVGFESTDAHSLATQIYSESLIQNITNVTLVETDAAAHKYSINLVNGGEGTFSMGGVVFSYTHEEAGKTAYKTYIQYIQPNGVDREIRVPTVKGQQIRITLAENCAGMLVDGVSKDFVAGDNIITANGSSLVITNPTAKPKITAIKPYAFVGSSEYTVTFKDWNGKILKAEIVAEGMSATAPANPTREGYTFTGWDKDFNNVQSDLIITAQYERVNEAVENVQAENITSRKVMINGQIYILRGDKTYTLQGQEVR